MVRVGVLAACLNTYATRGSRLHLSRSMVPERPHSLSFCIIFYVNEPVTESEQIDSGHAAETKPSIQIGPTKLRLPRVVVAWIAAVVTIGLLQWMAPVIDHQIANLVSMVVGLIVAVYIAFQVHQASRSAGHSYRIPLALTAIVVGFFTLFELDGFSGEMIPQFRYRFGSKRALKTVTELPVPAIAESAVDASAGFLGPNRNGVTPQRQFAIPTSVDEVKVAWDHGIGKGWASFAVVGDRAVTLEQRDELECVTCYRLSDGELLWLQSHQAYHYHPLGGAGPRSTPMIQGNRVFALGATGRLWCLNLETGDPIWSADLLKLSDWSEENFQASVSWGFAGSPLLVDDLCIVPLGGKVDLNRPDEGQRSLIAFDAGTGDVRWKAGSDQISYASPMLMTLAGQRQIVSVNEKTVTGHRLDNGEVLWSFDWPGSSNSNATCTSAVPAGANRFLIGKGYGGGGALVEVTKSTDDAFVAKPVWESTRVLKTKFTHACINDNIAYALNDGTLEAIELATGKKLWTQPRSARFGQGQILLADDVIVGQAEAGEVVFVSAIANEYQELLRLPGLSAKTWNIPTLAGRRLLVRNDRQVICYLLPEQR